MSPVATALLAALLPTFLLIFGLSSFSVYLYLKLRASRMTRDLELRPNPATTEQQSSEPAEPAESALPELVPRSFSDASNPDWKHDVHHAFMGLEFWLMDTKYTDVLYTNPGDEVRAKEILDAVGYKGLPTAVLLGWLRQKHTRYHVLVHIVTYVALANTSFESDPTSTLFPFSPELHTDLSNCFKALEGVKLSPEISTGISKIPSDIAAKHGGIDKKVLEGIMENLESLFFCLVESEMIHSGHNDYPHMGNHVVDGFLNTVTLRLRMLGSRQQFQFKWDESTETCICLSPALYSHAGRDGVLFDEPKLWWKCEIYDTAEDGECIRGE